MFLKFKFKIIETYIFQKLINIFLKSKNQPN